MAKTQTLRNAKPVTEQAHDHLTGDEPFQGRYRIYRLCVCFECLGVGKWMQGTKSERCPECRGEGKTLEHVATCANPQDVGCALVKLAEEGEFEDCPIGLLDRPEGEKGTWLIKPWMPSPRNVADAARVLAKAKGAK